MSPNALIEALRMQVCQHTFLQDCGGDFVPIMSESTGKRRNTLLAIGSFGWKQKCESKDSKSNKEIRKVAFQRNQSLIKTTVATDMRRRNSDNIVPRVPLE
jgi:hypothetical protein